MNTVYLAARLVSRGQIHVVSSDSEVAALASELGVGCEGEGDIDLNSALTCSVAMILAREPGNSSRDVLILPIDLTRSTAAAIAAVIAAQADAVVVPDRSEQGTNLLRLRGDAALKFKFQYGDDSFSKHRTEAESLGLKTEILRDPLLCFDVDTADDYAVWSEDLADPHRYCSREGRQKPPF